jgi:hypothetical protein
LSGLILSISPGLGASIVVLCLLLSPHGHTGTHTLLLPGRNHTTLTIHPPVGIFLPVPPMATISLLNLLSLPCPEVETTNWQYRLIGLARLQVSVGAVQYENTRSSSLAFRSMESPNKAIPTRRIMVWLRLRLTLVTEALSLQL